MKLNRSGVIAKKIGTTQIFEDNGQSIPVTLIQIEENVVIDTKQKKNNGLVNMQIAAFDQKIHRISKSRIGVFKKVKTVPKEKLKEFSVDQKHLLKVGTKISVEYFKKGQYVDITGVSIGKGYSGVMKRHNFKGLEATHGVSINHRGAGSTGQCQDPGKVYRGKKMAGQLGNRKVTLQNLLVVDIDTILNLLIVKGTIPGYKNNFVYVRDAVKKSYEIVIRD